MSCACEGYGALKWVIPDGYIPGEGIGGIRGHEAVCFVNTGLCDANVEMNVYFEDRDPIKGIKIKVGAQRSLHLWLSKPEILGGAVIPLEVPYSLVVESDRNIVVQHTRLDTRQNNMALMTAMAYRAD